MTHTAHDRFAGRRSHSRSWCDCGSNDPDAALRFRSTRHSVLKGLPDTPIIFRGSTDNSGTVCFSLQTPRPAAGWRTVGTIQNAHFGAVSTDNWLYADSCRFTNNSRRREHEYFRGNHFLQRRVSPYQWQPALALTCRVIPFSTVHPRPTHSRAMVRDLIRSPQ